MVYYVYGDYGYESQCELEVFNSPERAIQFVKGYTKPDGDMGNWSVIEVITFADSGEAIVHYRVDANDKELSRDWEDDNALLEDF